MELLAKASPFQTRELIVLFIMYGASTDKEIEWNQLYGHVATSLFMWLGLKRRSDWSEV